MKKRRQGKERKENERLEKREGTEDKLREQKEKKTGEEKRRDDTEDARTRNRKAAKLRFLNPLPQNTVSQRFGILE